ncbi:MAG: PilZ domain-containing protein [Deltaproteobacteria bacterium]|nr:PilZ domain-containing protein [Deltaproteobacteria bacterium]
MDEKRRAMRLKDENEITLTIVSGGKNPLKEKIFYNHSKNISMSGASIQTNIFLPVDTLLMIEMTLNILHQMITVLGKVKWTKAIFDNASYEAGVEFFTPPSDAIKKLADYISWKQKLSMLYQV